MKTSFVSILALAGCFMGVLSAPTAEAGLEERAADPTAIMSALYSTVRVYTAQINSTAASINMHSTPAEKATASSAIQKNIGSITAAVKSSTTQVKGLSKVKRQAPDANALAGIVANILLDIGGALNEVIADLGLTTVLGFAAPLTVALSALLLALEVVVNDLLAIVQALLDGLLTGLSAALAGLLL